jgi:hypothetical protein
MPRCLLQGYPCIDSQNVPDALVSICCSGTRCERSNNHSPVEYTCGGALPG